ncbi:MAG: Lrp/AsnC family transcriptional regulator [Syntrophomonadaceae bacterium]
MYYDDVETDLIEMLQSDIPLKPKPYEDLARRLNTSEGELVERISDMKEKGLIRRVGAILRHRQAGYAFNVMAVFKVEPEDEERAGLILAGYKEVSHCYLRQVPLDFGYNLFAMVHLHDESALKPLLDDMVDKTGLIDYQVIKSVREFKKTSMQYIYRREDGGGL